MSKKNKIIAGTLLGAGLLTGCLGLYLWLKPAKTESVFKVKPSVVYYDQKLDTSMTDLGVSNWTGSLKVDSSSDIASRLKVTNASAGEFCAEGFTAPDVGSHTAAFENYDSKNNITARYKAPMLVAAPLKQKLNSCLTETIREIFDLSQFKGQEERRTVAALCNIAANREIAEPYLHKDTISEKGLLNPNGTMSYTWVSEPDGIPGDITFAKDSNGRGQQTIYHFAPVETVGFGGKTYKVPMKANVLARLANVNATDANNIIQDSLDPAVVISTAQAEAPPATQKQTSGHTLGQKIMIGIDKFADLMVRDSWLPLDYFEAKETAKALATSSTTEAAKRTPSATPTPQPTATATPTIAQVSQSWSAGMHDNIRQLATADNSPSYTNRDRSITNTLPANFPIQPVTRNNGIVFTGGEGSVLGTDEEMDIGSVVSRYNPDDRGVVQLPKPKSVKYNTGVVDINQLVNTYERFGNFGVQGYKPEAVKMAINMYRDCNRGIVQRFNYSALRNHEKDLLQDLFAQYQSGEIKTIKAARKIFENDTNMKMSSGSWYRSLGRIEQERANADYMPIAA